jgi:Tol biopolymer transport system component
MEGGARRDGGSLCETGGFVGGWSPDGTEITFYAADSITSIGDICVVNVDGSGLRTVVTEPEPLDDDGDGRINEDDVDQTDNDQDTRVDEDAPTYNVEPSWSADGQRITYRSIRGANYEVHVVNADGSGDMNLTAYPGMDIEPDWSPDGQWIVFASDRDGDFLELYAMRADGSDVIRLTNDPGKDSDPSWSPR